MKELISIFEEKFDKGGELRAFTSPGRVNLIGEHTDYNGGFVFPAAIKLGTTIICRKRNDKIIRMAATDLEVTVLADINDLDKYKNIEWGNYQLGIASELLKDGVDVPGCDILYHDTIPHGGGLSSSAAIEVATALCFYTLATEKPADMKYLALIGQRAENNYIGVNCGIMDQFASAMGKEDHAIFLDCRDLSYSLVPLNIKGKSIVIANTNKKRSLVTSKYNERRNECDEALNALKKAIPEAGCLRDVTAQNFEKYSDLIENPVTRKRAEHVIFECGRVIASRDALMSGDIMKFGRLMNESHDSLRDLYEVTGIELDTLVNAARMQKGCIGARMTGAGFGGCTVNIVEDEFLDEFKCNVEKIYAEKIGYKPSFYITGAGDGGRELTEVPL